VSTRPRILLHSLIAAQRSSGTYAVPALWAQDVNTLASMADVHLLCPCSEGVGECALDTQIKVSELHSSDLATLVAESDLVQVPGNFGWVQSRHSFRLRKIARDYGKPVVVGISSNRARTVWMNRRRGIWGAAVAAMRFVDIRTAQLALVRNTAGVFVVGSGLRSLVSHPNIHVDVASWIRRSDLLPPESMRSATPRVCIASRLERMKGVFLGVQAAAAAVRRFPQMHFDVVGEGPERGELERVISECGIGENTRFLGQLAYPDQFFEYLRTADFVLLTNLNDEQPRLIFDAISQGCIPICPNSSPYVSLGLPSQVLYERGSLDSLTETLLRLLPHSPCLAGPLRAVAACHTIDSMHARRLEWMRASVVTARPGN
jgi:glycosyltransferase involved in cell wall biosynthesis